MGRLFSKQEAAQGLASSPGSNPWPGSVAKAIHPVSEGEVWPTSGGSCELCSLAAALELELD